MKRRITYSLLVLTIISMQLILAGGVGISPAYYQEFFEPNLTKTFSFHSFSSDPERGINTYVRGDLAEYVTLSEEHITGDGTFTATIKLPEKIQKPGMHTILIGAIEATNDIDSTLGGIAAIQGRIDIIVPFPGRYAESTFTITDINEGEEAKYEITSQNLGSEDLKVNTIIEVYKNERAEKILTETFKESTLKPKETLTIQGDLETEKLTPGEYQAFATINWGSPDIINKTFRVGEFIVEIIDYDYQFEQGKINPFNIQIQNKWNTPISEVFATVSITDSGTLVGDFKTVSVETSPWETKNITGYFDTSNLESKRYVARIEISYAGETTSKLVAIYVNDPATKTYRTYIILAILAIILIIATIIYLILKVQKLQSKNEKQK